MAKDTPERIAALITSFPKDDGHSVTHELLFERAADADAAAADARAFGCMIHLTAQDDEWLVELAYPTIATPQTTAPVSEALEDFARKHAGYYGGWRGDWVLESSGKARQRKNESVAHGASTRLSAVAVP